MFPSFSFRERNRHHAKRSRQRKRNYMTQLEDAVHDMRKENDRLFDLLGMDSTRAKADMNKEHERKKQAATERFIAGLKQPRNRVLDNTTLAFLRELWK
jgi:Basic region leucine zipper